jgi:hypothetical protein
MDFMRKIVLACIAVCLYIQSPALNRDSMVPDMSPGWEFPGKKLVNRGPKDIDIHTDVLAAIGALKKKAYANGSLIRNGCRVVDQDCYGHGYRAFDVHPIQWLPLKNVI